MHELLTKYDEQVRRVSPFDGVERTERVVRILLPIGAALALLRRAGLPDIRFHDLRHTFATLQLTAGTNPKIVSEVLGHKDIAITLDRYSHALPTMQTEAMARLDAVLRPLGARCSRARPAPAADPLLWVDEEPGRGSRRSRKAIRVQPARGGQRRSPIRAWIGPKLASLVPHTGCPVNRLMRLSRVHPVPRRDI